MIHLSFRIESSSCTAERAVNEKLKANIHTENDPFGNELLLDNCEQIIGDEVERVVAWANGTDVEPLAGQTVRLRFEMKDADIYSFRFRPLPDPIA